VKTLTEYPEHEKLKAVQEKSQAIGSFLEWLTGTKKYVTAKYVKVWNDEIIDSEEDVSEENREDIYDQLIPESLHINNILAEYYEIDLKKLEQEKCAMLEELRKLNSTVKS
jgi:hypothetical protein